MLAMNRIISVKKLFKFFIIYLLILNLKNP